MPVKKRALSTLLITILIFLFSYIWLLSAWISDDAYISFRTVDNFIHGFGLTWNSIERVQSFTNPFWVFAVTIMYLIIPDIYFASLLLSFLLSLLSILIGLLILKNYPPTSKVVFILSLLSSRAFIDYTSSGLENPLTVALISIFLLIFLTFDNCSIQKRTLLITFLSALLFFNRIDSIIMILPSVIYSTFVYFKKNNSNKKWIHKLLLLFIVLMPAWLWLVFSLIYYGFPLPNTAYAKLFINDSLSEKIQQGFYYFNNSWNYDFITQVIIVSAILFGFSLIRRNFKITLLAMGLCLQYIYILYTGGDFMAGRFFSAPFFLATITFVFSAKYLKRSTLILTLTFWALIVYNIEKPHAPYKNDITYAQEWDYEKNNGIADERGFYFPYSSLLKQLKKREEVPPWVTESLELKDSSEQVIVAEYAAIGFLGYAAGPKKYIVDQFALSNAFLARISAEKGRIGHRHRKFPVGYIKSLKSGENLISDPFLSKLYDEINLITKAPLFSLNRFKTIIKLNFNSFLKKEFY